MHSIVTTFRGAVIKVEVANFCAAMDTLIDQDVCPPKPNTKIFLKRLVFPSADKENICYMLCTIISKHHVKICEENAEYVKNHPELSGGITTLTVRPWW